MSFTNCINKALNTVYCKILKYIMILDIFTSDIFDIGYFCKFPKLQRSKTHKKKNGI